MYRVNRIWDDGGVWYHSPSKYYETVEAACAAAERYIDWRVLEGEYGQADEVLGVTVWYAIEDEDGDEVAVHSYEVTTAERCALCGVRRVTTLRDPGLI